MVEDLQGFVRLWERICKDSQDFGGGFARIRETLGEYLQDFRRGFVRLWVRNGKDSLDFGRGFTRI